MLFFCPFFFLVQRQNGICKILLQLASYIFNTYCICHFDVGSKYSDKISMFIKD